MSDAFYKSSFFLNYLTLLYDGDQLQYLLMHCFDVRVSSVLLLCSSKRPLCGLWCFRISVFFVWFLYYLQHVDDVYKPNIQKVNIYNW